MQGKTTVCAQTALYVSYTYSWFLHFTYLTWFQIFYVSFHWKCYTPEIHQIKTLRFLGISCYRFTLSVRFSLNLYPFWSLNLYRLSFLMWCWVSWYGGLWGCSIVSGTSYVYVQPKSFFHSQISIDNLVCRSLVPRSVKTRRRRLRFNDTPNAIGCIPHICMVLTGWRRLIGSPKLQIIFHKRATKYRSLGEKMNNKDTGSYESSPPCNTYAWSLHLA